MSDNIALFRKRFLPHELTWLKDDDILHFDDEKIVTCWKPLKPRDDFSAGKSTYYRKKGLKISRIYDKEGNFIHWYCDIVMEQGVEGLNCLPGCEMKNHAEEFIENLSEHNGEKIIVYTDLLVDIIVNPDGLIEVADLDECVDMFRAGMITEEQLSFALHTAHDYLATLYSRYHSGADFTSPEYVVP